MIIILKSLKSVIVIKGKIAYNDYITYFMIVIIFCSYVMFKFKVHVRIVTALGQVMLYVDGMNGIIAHIETIQWLYELLDSPVKFL